MFLVDHSALSWKNYFHVCTSLLLWFSLLFLALDKQRLFWWICYLSRAIYFFPWKGSYSLLPEKESYLLFFYKRHVLYASVNHFCFQCFDFKHKQEIHLRISWYLKSPVFMTLYSIWKLNATQILGYSSFTVSALMVALLLLESVAKKSVPRSFHCHSSKCNENLEVKK